jgi:hypothetical protein
VDHVLGAEFLAALGRYTRAYAFRHPTGADFVSALRVELGEVVNDVLKPGLEEAGTIDYAIATVRTEPVRPPLGGFGEGEGRREVRPRDRPPVDEDDRALDWRSEVTVVNLGQLSPSVTIELRFSDGESVRERWDPGRTRKDWLRPAVRATFHTRITSLLVMKSIAELPSETPGWLSSIE